MRKLQALTLLYHEPDLDARALIARLGSGPEATRMLLLRLSRQGLLQRRRDPVTHELYYRLTAKGHARLAFLRRSSRPTR